MTKEISQQIAVDIDYLLDNSKDIKKDYLRCIKDWQNLFGLPYEEVAEIAQFHVVNIHKYAEMFYDHKDTFFN